jgi:hypothetical protein
MASMIRDVRRTLNSINGMMLLNKAGAPKSHLSRVDGPATRRVMITEAQVGNMLATEVLPLYKMPLDMFQRLTCATISLEGLFIQKVLECL